MLRTLDTNQMRIAKETTIFGLSKNIETRNFESASQKKLSTQVRIDPYETLSQKCRRSICSATTSDVVGLQIEDFHSKIT